MTARRTFKTTVTIDGVVVGEATRFAHNSAVKAGLDMLRDSRSGLWERVGSHRITTVRHTIRYTTGTRDAVIDVEEVVP